MVQNCLLNNLSLRNAIIAVVYKEESSEPIGLETRSTLGSSVATAAIVTQLFGVNYPKPSFNLLVTGLCRIKVDKLLQTEPYGIALITQLDRLKSELSDVLILQQLIKFSYLTPVGLPP